MMLRWLNRIFWIWLVAFCLFVTARAILVSMQSVSLWWIAAAFAIWPIAAWSMYLGMELRISFLIWRHRLDRAASARQSYIWDEL